MKITESSKVKSEIDFFEISVKKLKSEKAKTRANNIITKIKSILSEIDISHDSNYNGYIAPNRLKDSRDNLNKLRHELNQIIKNN